MKLTHLAIAVSVALGLAACGGSSDDAVDNSTGTDEKPEAERPADPTREVVDYEIEKGLQALVSARKLQYASTAARDLIVGYAPNAGIVGVNKDPNTNPGFAYISDSTDAANIKRLSSAVNYVEAGQLRSDAIDQKLNGAVLANPGFTYAKGANGVFYRMEPVGKNWDEVEPDTKYAPVSPAAKVEATSTVKVLDQFPGGVVSQDALYFLPNVTKSNHATLRVKNSGSLGIDDAPGGVDQINPKNLKMFATSNTSAPEAVTKAQVTAKQLLGGQAFDYDGTGDTVQALTVAHGEVQLGTVHFNGGKYDLSRQGNQKIDLNSIPLNKPVPVKDASNTAIQYLPVAFDYYTVDNKGTNNLPDDASVERQAKAGAMKAYNLPYSLAFVTVNQAGAEKKNTAAGAAARNFFDFPDQSQLPGNNKDGHFGAYQVIGFQTPFLPENGRADYYGKSFGVDSEGDVRLRLDFGYEGSGISGSVINRTSADGKKELPEINLGRIQLSTPTVKATGTDAFGGAVAAGAATSRYQNGTWEVQLFGPEAEEAGGFIEIKNNGIIPGDREVFTSKRTEMTDKSNIAPSNR